MDAMQLDHGELVAVLGGAILGASVFPAWFALGDKYTACWACAEDRARRARPGDP